MSFWSAAGYVALDLDDLHELVVDDLVGHQQPLVRELLHLQGQLAAPAVIIAYFLISSRKWSPTARQVYL
jgi:hypothetical protein